MFIHFISGFLSLPLWNGPFYFQDSNKCLTRYRQWLYVQKKYHSLCKNPLDTEHLWTTSLSDTHDNSKQCNLLLQQCSLNQLSALLHGALVQMSDVLQVVGHFPFRPSPWNHLGQQNSWSSTITSYFRLQWSHKHCACKPVKMQPNTRVCLIFKISFCFDDGVEMGKTARCIWSMTEFCRVRPRSRQMSVVLRRRTSHDKLISLRERYEGLQYSSRTAQQGCGGWESSQEQTHGKTVDNRQLRFGQRTTWPLIL